MRLSVRKATFVAALVAAVLALAVVPGWAQSGTTSIGGRVTDPQEGLAVGASVTVTNIATGLTRATVTNGSGHYQFAALPPGVYNMTISLAGFRTAKLEKLELRVDLPARRDVVLTMGEMAEELSVVAEGAMLNTVDASIGNTISEQTIRALPIEARNVVQLLSLQPGAVFVPRVDPASVDPRYGAVSGARADQQNVTLDGIDVNDAQLQTAYTSAVRVTQEALQEFRVSTSNYGATMGRSSGPQVSLVTKSGSNEFRGSAYWVPRRTGTSSNEYFLKLAQQSSGVNEAPKLDKNIFGASLGGPIMRDRFFFFANVETLDSDSERPVLRSVPSNSFRDGVLVYRCATASQCPGGSVRGFNNTHTVQPGWYGLTPAQIAAIDPLGIGPSTAASQYFRQFPGPNEPGRDGVNIMDFRFASPIADTYRTYIMRLDYKLTQSGQHNVFGRVNYQDDAISDPAQYPDQDPRSQQLLNNIGFAFGYDGVFGNNLMNSFRYGMTKIDEQKAGRISANYNQFRFVDSFDPVTFTSTRLTPGHYFKDELSWLKGTHTLKVGASVGIIRIPSTRESGSYLSASVNPSWVAGIGRRYMPGNAAFCTSPGCNAVPAVASNFAAGYADAWLNVLGVLSQATLRANYNPDGSLQAIGSPVEREYGTDEYEFYVQDSWRLTSKLTVTAGVRYSLFSPPYETQGRQVAPTISMGQWFNDRAEGMLQGVPANRSPLVTFDLAGPVNGKKGYYEWDKNNFGPSLAVAWSPNDRWVVRAGYTKVFDRIGQGLALNFDGGFAFGMSTTISSPFGAPYETNPAVRFQGINVMPPTIPAAPAGGFPQTPPRQAGIITQSIDDTLKTPSAHMVNFAIGRELGKNFSVEAAYVGRFGRDLLIRRDLAMPLNLVDTRSGMDYFTAAQLMIKAAQARGLTGGSPASAYAALANIPYWENLFPAAAGGGLSATQAMARAFMRNAPDFITALYEADEFCEPACSIHGPFAYFADQYDSLAAISSLGRANYNALQVTLRKRYSKGLQFDVNYTFSSSKDNASESERGSAFGGGFAGTTNTFNNGGYSAFLVNSFDPDSNYGTSDFDVTHQINFNWIWDLPLARGSSGFTKAVLGDWSVSGLARWTSGFPFNVYNCRSCWVTNWNLQGNASLVEPGRLPPTNTTMNAVDGRPSPYEDAKDALSFFRLSLPGEVGIRNELRGDGYFSLDTSLSKAFTLGGRHKLRIRWDVFNVTNTPKFDTGQLTMFPDLSGFGRYNGTLATCDAQAGRCMQFAVRYEF